MSVTQNEKAARFRALHDGPAAFVIPNPWDVASARVLDGLGFEALATSSAASACAQGRRDGGLTRDEALAHARMIVDASDLPVSADLENGFGDAPAVVAVVLLTRFLSLIKCAMCAVRTIPNLSQENVAWIDANGTSRHGPWCSFLY